MTYKKIICKTCGFKYTSHPNVLEEKKLDGDCIGCFHKKEKVKTMKKTNNKSPKNKKATANAIRKKTYNPIKKKKVVAKKKKIKTTTTKKAPATKKNIGVSKTKVKFPIKTKNRQAIKKTVPLRHTEKQKPRKLPRTKILEYLQKKKRNVTKNTIAKETKIKPKTINNALRTLRKMKKVGYCRSNNKTYWGLK